MPSTNSNIIAGAREEMILSLREKDNKTLSALIGSIGSLISDFERNYPSHIDTEVDGYIEDVVLKLVEVQKALELKRRLLNLRDDTSLIAPETEG